MKTQHIASEDDFLALIAAAFPNTHTSLILGRGDDCAEIACPPRMAVSTDLFVEDVHFRSAYFTPFEVGYKALAVSISDLAAAGAAPLGAAVGLTAPVPFPRAAALGIIDGMAHAARTHGLVLAGGDLSRGEKLCFCVTVWGGPARIPERNSGKTPDTPQSDATGKTPGGHDAPFLRRGPVRPGDALFLYGRAGLARAGLLVLEQDGRDAAKRYPEACAAHLTPVPLVEAGLAFASIPGCRLMDVSDGLARDLPRMLRAWRGAKENAAGADITLPETALHPETIAVARSLGMDPVRFAFEGGEDYALLGSCPASSLEAAVKAAAGAAAGKNPAGPFLHLGTVTENPGIICNGIPLSDAGFDHFTGKDG